MDEAERRSHLAYIYYGKLIADGTPDTLRTLPDITPPGTHRFEITAGEVTSVLRTVVGLSGVRSTTIFGRAIHALVEESVTAESLAADLRSHGVRVEEIRSLVPSLEDVFVELTYRRQRELEARA